MKLERKITRRQALQISAGASVPMFIPARLLADDAPSKKITMGFIGVGWMGGDNLSAFLGQRDCRVVAIADVDQRHLHPAVDKVNNHYKNKDCKGYKDFRELLARNDIDAVCISTPDHWHSITAVEAARAKKDIYCEKPLSHTFAEGVAMVEAVTKNDRIWQTGSWQRSVPNFRQGAELVLNGYIGGPQEVSGTATFPPKDAVWNTATKYRVECKYPNEVELVIAGGYPEIKSGTKWIGDNGWVWVDRGGFKASDEHWIKEIQEREKKKDLATLLPVSPGHQRQFLDCVKSRQKTLTPVEIAHRSQTPGHLGYIASVVGRKLKWDAARQEIVDDPEASKLLSREMRAPWHL